jgi:guanine deaminase
MTQKFVTGERELHFMQEAVKLAREGMNRGSGGPFGCIVVKADNIIGLGYNQVVATHDPTAHAEIIAIRDACRHLNNFQLTDCEIYTTCEPCPMCLGAIYWARPAIIYYANKREDAAHAGFDDDFIYREIGLLMSERKIPMIGVGRESALSLFEDWRLLENKTLY